jgi:alkanesulfonate monooxygenase SsuD/methylene tetrahydromethanopterin reductase-like flavin-dependent oxidoreductase (luciferase family)
VVAVDIQLASTHTDWPTLREASLRVERAGFDALWVFDHLAGVALGGDRNLECFTWLGALAEATSTIELGAMVANSWNRQVGTLAAAAASVAAISGRRFLLGIGAGTAPGSRWATEQQTVGADLADGVDERHARVEEFLELTDAMWSPTRSDEFATFLLPMPRPPRIVGVNSLALSKLAGHRADGINVAWEHPRRNEFLAAGDAGADHRPRPFIKTAWTRWAPELLDGDHPVRREMAAAELDRIILVVLDDVDAFTDAIG